jgi:hypothetical protein
MAWASPLEYMGVVSYGMYMLNTLVLDCLKPIFNRFGPHHPLLQKEGEGPARSHSLRDFASPECPSLAIISTLSL